MKKSVKISLIALAVILLALVGASIYFLNYALSQDKVYDEQREVSSLKETYPWTVEWIDSIMDNHALLDTTITNAEGDKIHAFYLPAKVQTKKTAVLVHGYKDCGIMMLRYGYIYNTEMVVHGLSMGSATTMMVSGEEETVPSCVKCYIEDCGYTSVWDEFGGELKNQFGLPTFPLMDATSIACKLRYGWSFKEASALKQVEKCRRPMLFIHGDADDFVPTKMVYPLYEAHHGPKDMWIAEGSAHAMAYHDHPEEYVKEVKSFLQKYNK